MVEPNIQPLTGIDQVIDFVTSKFSLDRLLFRPTYSNQRLMWVLTIKDSKWEVQALSVEDCFAELARLVAQDLLETR